MSGAGGKGKDEQVKQDNFFFFFNLARMQPPTTTNYTVEFPTFGEMAVVSKLAVQRLSVALRKPPL